MEPETFSHLQRYLLNATILILAAITANFALVADASLLAYHELSIETER